MKQIGIVGLIVGGILLGGNLWLMAAVRPQLGKGDGWRRQVFSGEPEHRLTFSQYRNFLTDSPLEPAAKFKYISDLQDIQNSTETEWRSKNPAVRAFLTATYKITLLPFGFSGSNPQDIADDAFGVFLAVPLLVLSVSTIFIFFSVVRRSRVADAAAS
jgi:hypothetical protein